MKIHYLFTIIIIILLSAKASAQVKSTSQPGAQKSSVSKQSDSLTQALNNVKNLFKVKRDTISIVVSGIEYDDANLSHLKDNLKKLKGVKSVLVTYKDSAAAMKVSYKGKATDLWDNLPADSKEQFRILEVGNDNLKLKYKNEKGTL